MPLAAYTPEPGEWLRPASLDSEGFVHCTTDEQTLLAVANTYYRDADGPHIALEIDIGRLSAEVRFEAAAPGPPPGVAAEVPFPHVYGAIEYDAIVGMRYARRSVDGTYVGFERRPEIAERLDLLPHPEGGWFRRTWTSRESVQLKRGVRATATAILYLLPDGQTSHPHSVASQELWLWHGPGEVELTVDDSITTLGTPTNGNLPQVLVPEGALQSARARGDVLVSCVVSPGFDFADFRMY
ncbi:MAG: DUF952 domain-containing protein [Actinophytocola sp.]|nr:DUF952 domain-containing protein [Actinophytocola sp.]